MELTPAFTRAQGQEEDSLKGQGRLFNGFEGSLCELVQHPGKVPGGDAPPTLGSFSVKTIQGRVRFPSLLALMGEFPSLSAMADL